MAERVQEDRNSISTLSMMGKLELSLSRPKITLVLGVRLHYYVPRYTHCN